MSNDNNDLYDFQVGQLTGHSYNAWSSLGNSYQTPPESSPVIRQTPVKGSSFPTLPTGYAPTPRLTKQERKARDRKWAEKVASDRDDTFTFLMFLASTAGMGYVDYAYMQQWPWWAHLLFVPVPAVLLVVLLRKLKLMRLLRRTVTTIVVTGIAYGLLGYFDVVPSITSVWTF